MEAHSHFGKVGGNRSGQMFANRKTSVLVALLSAVLAGVLIYLFMTHYAKKPAPVVVGPTTATVFEASQFIAPGTPSSLVASDSLLTSKVVPLGSVMPGAITDPAAIAGKVSAIGIEQGQQITATDFTSSAVSLDSYLKGDQRAVGLQIDAATGMTTFLAAGNTVDVVALGKKGSFPLFQDITVLANRAGIVYLRLTDKQVLVLSNAESAKAGLTLRLSLRPATGATDSVGLGQIVGY